MEEPAVRRLSTEEVAQVVGINPATLERWLSSGKLKPPKQMRVGRRVFRLWRKRDIKRVERYKEKHYRKGRGRKRSAGLFPALPLPN